MEKYVIPEAKLTRHALDKTRKKGRDKAVAFDPALGFTSDDADEVMQLVYRWMGRNDPVRTGENQWGEIYTADIPMTGKNGKRANARTGWLLSGTERIKCS